MSGYNTFNDGDEEALDDIRGVVEERGQGGMRTREGREDTPLRSHPAAAEHQFVWTLCGGRVLRLTESQLIISLTVLGVLVGGLVGGLVGAYGHPSRETVEVLGLPGTLLLRVLKMLVTPLIVASMIVGVSSLGKLSQAQQSQAGHSRHRAPSRGNNDPEEAAAASSSSSSSSSSEETPHHITSGHLGRNTILMFLSITLLAVVLGLTLVAIIQPGAAGADLNAVPEGDRPDTSLFDSIMGIIKSMLTDNLVEAAYDFNVLGLIVFSLFFGSVLARMPSAQARPVIDFFTATNEALMRMVKVVVWTVPLGVASLICARLAGNPDFWDLLAKLGLYVLCVLLGLLIHGAGTLCVMFYAITRRNPYHYLRSVSQAILTAFGTASSSATLPITITNVTNAGVDELTANFVLPLGATINMSGSALYEGVAAVFIAQVHGIPLDAGRVIVIAVTATLAAVGAAGIPEAGLVTMVMVLQAAGLPLTGIELLLSVDWFLDRCRTAINVASDTMAASMLDEIERKSGKGE